MSISYIELRKLSKDIPPMAILSDFPYGPSDRIAQSFLELGINLKIINLTTEITSQAELHDLANIREIPGDSKKNLQKLKVLQSIFQKKHPQLNRDYEYFFSSHDLRLPLTELAALKNAQIIFISNVYALGGNNVPLLIGNKPTIYRLSCFSPLTGYCSYSAGCKKWQTAGCSECPQLGLTSDGKDLCKEVFQEKYKNYKEQNLNLAFSTPSKWLSQEVKNSLIGKNFYTKNIATSVDLNIFKPGNRAIARKNLDIHEDTPVILIGSAGLRKNKGLHVVCNALSQIKEKWSKRPTILFFGYDNANMELLEHTGVHWKALGWINSPSKLAQAYNTADIFISSSFQDNLPNTVNESLSCGTPVICFDQFSSEEVVINGITGFVAKHPGLPLSPEGFPLQKSPYEVSANDCADLAEKILTIVNSSSKELDILRKNCRLFAEKYFDPHLQTLRYILLYRDMLNLPDNIAHDFLEDEEYFTRGLTRVNI